MQTKHAKKKEMFFISRNLMQFVRYFILTVNICIQTFGVLGAEFLKNSLFKLDKAWLL